MTRTERQTWKKLFSINCELFAEAYHDALNAKEDSGVCFIDLTGKRIAVQNGRRIVLQENQPK